MSRRAGESVALVLVGDELLLGHVVDGNAAWLGRRLDDAGLRVVSSAHAPDDIEAIARAVRRAAEDAPAVVVTGGLGPTSDDVTREALARVAATPLVRDADVERTIRAWYAGRDAPVPPAALRMAELPAGARTLGNGTGSAPGVTMELDGPSPAVVHAVPGVPGEMRAMVEELVLPDLVHRAGSLPAVATRTLLVVGLGESAVAARLAPLEATLAGARIAYLAAPSETTVRLRVTASPGEQDVAAGLAEALAGTARELLGDAVATEGGTGLAAAVLTLLAGAGATVATAESLTGGLVAGALTDVPGASAVVVGGAVTYATRTKADVLGVDSGHLARRGAVDPATAAAMAAGTRARFGATYGVAATGVAGPEPDEGHPPGVLHAAVAGPAGVRVSSPRLRGDRGTVRRSAVVHALDLLRRTAAGLGPAPGESPGRPPG
ncbi:MAG TPA: CinA family nicotinamide mononucleotide deamidase-related protein [Jiangellales bacterium]|nr:CinA family nicotinamide mononucleotide deamidase-related protein [Jiangellales bacterium]